MASDAADLIADLGDVLAHYAHDPLGFVRWAFPWGRDGLAAHAGPDAWQADLLTEIGRGVATDRHKIQTAVASGKGIGKSALVSWIALWALLTREHTRGVITAGTEPQLRTKTMPEIAKWLRLCACRDLIDVSATAMSVRGHTATWRLDAIPWNEHNPEAFAGLHNQGSRILVIFDEASQIARTIWDTTDGIMSDIDTEVIWPVFGNPTQPEGRFRECFGSAAGRWRTRQIDSRTVAITDKAELASLVAQHGEDSDYVRVNVRGVFPRAGQNQLIASDAVACAASPQRGKVFNDADPVVVGVDVARFGLDESVIATRKGRDGRSIPLKSFRGLDTQSLAAKVAEHLTWLTKVGAPADAVFVDETGVGGGVVDRLRVLGYRVIGVNNGATGEPVDGVLVRNKGAECWVRMRDWLGTPESGGTIPHDDRVLHAQLESRQYSYDAQMRIVLESKDDMERRGVGSPDRADAVALTFAQPIGSRRQQDYEEAARERKRYDPLERVR